MRFAIWAAVSTESQAAADKVSLPDQIEKCRLAAIAKGWIETTQPYTIPGESRTRWVNLRDAELEIPSLKTMLDDAQARKYDVLVMVDYNRLRDLLDPASKSLSHYGVQIYSLAQPVEPLPPDDYSPYASDSSVMMQGLSHIINQAQISDLRRKYRTAMPRRITDRGLPAHIPWGYRKPPGRETDRAAVPVQELDKCAVLIAAKDALLSGQSLSQIVEIFNNSSFPPPRGRTWWPQTVRGLLRNSFYAGIVKFGMTQAKLDPRTGNRYRDRKHPNKAVSGQGKHTALWDIATHQAIIAELSRRGINYKGRRNNQFTGLVKCGQCGLSMWIHYDGHHQKTSRPEWRVWRCSSGLAHRSIKHDELISRVGEELKTSIMNVIKNNDHMMDNPIDRKDLADQRKRLEDAYQAGVLSLESFSTRIAELDNIEQQQANTANRERDYQVRLAALRSLADSIEQIPSYLAGADPQEVNRLLHMLLHKITVGEKVILDYK